LGGSTEINSGFWHRAPREILARWNVQTDLHGASEDDLAPHYAWAEQMLGVGLHAGPWPKSTELFARGVERMGWSYQEVPRAAPGCRGTNTCAQGCPTGAKQGMSRRILPAAERAGARIVTRTRVLEILKHKRRVTGVIARRTRPDGTRRVLRIDAENIFVCAGPTETPSLLLRSGIKAHAANSLRIHPYLKVAAVFDEPVGASTTPLPLLQVKEFAPDLTLGGAFFSPGQLAMTLSEDWPRYSDRMLQKEEMALYYVGVKGAGKGWVHPNVLGEDSTEAHYELSPVDARNLGVGLARIGQLLLAAGAREVIPSAWGVGPMIRERDAVRWLDEPLPIDGLGLVTVHAFSSCPIGERRDRCVADSYGKVFAVDNLRISDASMLPDSPGVNPQGTVMALARRNARQFLDERRAKR